MFHEKRGRGIYFVAKEVMNEYGSELATQTFRLLVNFDSFYFSACEEK